MRERPNNSKARMALAIVVAHMLAWGGVPAPALAEATEGGSSEAAITESAVPADEGSADGDGQTGATVAREAANDDVTPAASDEEIAPETDSESAPGADEESSSVAGGESIPEPGDDAVPEPGEESVPAADETPALSAQTDGELPVSGSWGACPWEISADGTLTVSPGVVGNWDVNYTYGSPWVGYEDSITSVVFLEDGDDKVVFPEYSGNLFYKFSNVTSIDFSGADVSSVEDMRNMFYGCSSLASIEGISDWSLNGRGLNLSSLFSGCSSLTSIDLSGWDTKHVLSMYGMFYGCSSLTSIEGISAWNTQYLRECSSMFSGCTSLTSLDFSGWTMSSVTDTHNMFDGCSSLASLDLSGWDTKRVTNMEHMFSGCSSLASLDLSGWDASSVKDMSDMFNGCSSLVSLNATDWVTSSVEDMDKMFLGCSSLASIEGISDWDMSTVTNTSSMFSGCTSLDSLDLSSWNTQSVTSTDSMFLGCTSLDSLDLSGWNTQSLSITRFMLSGCSSLTSIEGISDWNTSSVLTMRGLFFGCTSLDSLDLSGWSTESLRDMYLMFFGCSPQTITIGENYIIGDVSMFPKERDGYLWHSEYTGDLLTSTDILETRYVFADIYTQVKAPRTDISGATIAPINGRNYDGKPYEPKPKVTLDGKTLVLGTDYTLTYRNNVSASTKSNPAVLTVTGIGDYTGTATATFQVWKNGQPMEAWAVMQQAPAASVASRDVTVEAPIHVAHAVSAGKPMEYSKKGGDSRLNVDTATGRVTVRKGTPAGTYKVTIRAIAHGGANYADGSRTVECQVKVVSGAKMDQSFEVTAADVTRTASSLAGADYLTRPFSVAMAAGNVTYKWASGSGCLSVDAAGRLKVAKGTAPGTYYAKVWVTAAGDAGYNACTRTVTVKVVVK